MIISHKHKFIFIKTKKTASTSLEIALSRICGEEDIITPNDKRDEILKKKYAGLAPQNYSLPYKHYGLKDWAKLILRKEKKMFKHHNTAEEIKKYISKDIWDSYYKFCFERHPLDKAISHYFWLGRRVKFNSVQDYIDNGGIDRIRGFHSYSINGKVAVDKVYKYENLDESLLDLSQKLGLEETIKISNINAKSFARKDKRHYTEVLTKEQQSIILNRFKKECDLMGYE